MIAHIAAATLAFIFDRLIGDPPHWPHPVRFIGAMIKWLESRLNKGSFLKIKGVLMLLLVLGSVFGIGISVIIASYHIHIGLGIVAEAILIFFSIACRSLKEAGISVYEPLQTGDLEQARLKLSYIVGRDTASLNESEIARGAIETVAENTSDGVTAPLFWALIGGGAAAMIYRAINTCDSMVGYQNEKYQAFGWASARLDDAVNWLPARLTAVVMLWSYPESPYKKGQVWQIIKRDAPKHPSPNSGWGEAAVAGLLGIELGGINTYGNRVSDRARMGNGDHHKSASHILMSITIMERTSLLFLLLMWIGGIIYELAGSWI
ncbi:adenosylcobinamide-phosphate synthase [Bacillus ectoiniformans]|uniref:adenosylcobinamide-phosphate synthase CbiB n=1 Tax=Bacillus ectoiniformans TaxID=1494429 RepID=UPI00195CD417|nr:adenosylcobinamide-phosphate synthase CbiB [Bacillus ectoiniformans]MBM7649554.1 adenosylcobinamide-phosphate synthase [Bacillus ectoiniformans]